MTRGLLGLIIALTVVTLIVVGAIALLCGNTTGTRWLINTALARSPIAIEAQRIDGSLLRGVRIGALRIQLEDSVIEIESLEAVPAWAASLTKRTLVIERLAAASISVAPMDDSKPPPDPRPDPLVLAIPALPLPIDIRSLRVDRLIVDGIPDAYTPAIRGRVGFDGAVYTLRGLDLSSPALQIGGDLTLTPSPDVPVNGTLRWRLRDPAVSGRIELTNSLRELGVDVRMNQPVRGDLRGRVYLLGETEPRFDLTVSIAEWTTQQLHAVDLRVTLAGTRMQFDAHGGVVVNAPDLPQAQLTAEVSGSLDALDVAQIVLTTARGRAIAHGRIERAPELAAALAVDVEGFDPGLVDARLSGALSGHVDVEVRNEDLHLAVESLAGEFNRAAFEATGQFSRIAGVWSARGVDLRSGPNHIVLALDWDGDRVRGEARLNMPDLATLIPQLNGDLTGMISIDGTREKPRVAVTADSRQLHYLDWSATEIHVSATVKEGSSNDARLTIVSVERNDVVVERVEVAARGSLDHVDATLGWSFDNLRGAVDLSANHVDEAWNFAIAEGALMTLPGDLWRLDRRATGTLVDGGVSVSAHCWLTPNGKGRACVDSAAVLRDRVRLAGAIDKLPVEMFTGNFEDLGALIGTVSGRWDVASDAQRWRGTAALETEGLALADATVQNDDHALVLPKVTATADFENDHATLALQAVNSTSRVLDLNLDVGGFDRTASLSGHATVAIDDLGFVATFSRRLGEIKGGLNGVFEIGGSIAAPSVSGELTIRDARAVLLEPHVEITALDLTMQLKDLQQVDIRGSAQSDSGRIDIDGVLFEPLGDARRFHARVNARDVPMRIPDVDVKVGGELDVDWHPGLVSVTGRVEVPRAAITITELPPGAVAVSRDVVVIDRVDTLRVGTRLKVDVELVLKDNVRFSAFGLSTGLTGNLRLKQSVDGVVQLEGTLTLVNGSFKAFGQVLAIESGRLTYSGPPDNPYVDARAIRTIEEPGRRVTVGAQIQGPARAIETTLFSDPAMSEADTLAYLVIGRPLSVATEQEGSNVMGAAIALGLKGAAPVIDEVRNVFGLEELTATGGGAEDLTVIAGKRFSKRVFVKYSYQTFTRMSAILIELMLTSRLGLEATASEIPAIDLIYQVRENN